ncbi:TolC family protein [Pelobacter seleniigenes]|uniref:TolC family protein n=1 Tax=Pelobacter seleniigenes TaxID=407188 RepID=UPI0004A717D4|nr:TolC family protein [Pelobacter seleniigenes]
MKMIQFLQIPMLLSVLLLLSSCLPSSQNNWPEQAKTAEQQVHHWSQLNGNINTDILNTLIVSPQLANLVTEALVANPELQQTLLTLKIRQTEYNQTRGAEKPTLEVNATTEKEEHSETSYTGSLSVSWELDLWQKLNDESKAAAKDVAEQQAIYQSARDTLASEIMKSWLELIAAGKNISVQKQRIITLKQNATFIRQRYRNGLKDLTDLDSARTSLASANATLEEYQEDYAQQLRSLASMLGRLSPMAIQIPEDFPVVLIPLADVPEQTLSRRPDLKAAYLAIEAASLRTIVAYKELLPSISLQAAIEDIGKSPKAALLNDPVWSLLAGLTAPLYQGGQLKSAARIAELETEQAYQAYRETLVSAIEDVEKAISLEKSLLHQQGHIEEALAAARNTLTQYQQSYRSGLIDILDLLDVEEQTYDLEEQLNNLIYNRLANRIDLGLALGLGVSA